MLAHRRRPDPMERAQDTARELVAALEAMEKKARPGGLRRALLPGLLVLARTVAERLGYLAERE